VPQLNKNIAFWKRVFILLLVMFSIRNLQANETQGGCPEVWFLGDSLSDAGNKYQITLSLNQSSQGAIGVRALPPNVQGRFSNGWTFADYVTQEYQHQPSKSARKDIFADIKLMRDETESLFRIRVLSAVGNNWAVGGALAGPGYFHDFDVQPKWRYLAGGEIMPNLHQQLLDALDHQPLIKPKDWLILQGGTNNLWFSTFGSLQQSPLQAAKALKATAQLALEKGVKHLLLMNIPSLENALAFNQHKVAATSYIQSFNQQLLLDVQALRLAFPQASVVLLDAYSLYERVETQIQKQGAYQENGFDFRVVQAKGSAWNTETGVIAKNPSQYLSWDGLHPTTAAHQLLADEALRVMLKINPPCDE
jgi:phospholipase/lecithinase/hemolysin